MSKPSATITGIKRIVRQVLEERDEQVREEVITFRTLSINFEERWFGWDGERIQIDTVGVDIPVLDTEHPIVPAKPWKYHA